VIITKRHVAAFDRPVARNLECRLVGHVKRVLPERCEQLGEAEVRRRVRRAIRQAGSHGIAAAYDICRYVDLTFFLGEEFDADGSCPWATGVLQDGSLTPAEKLDRLYEAARKQLGAQLPESE
jgi:hypothetical protein